MDIKSGLVFIYLGFILKAPLLATPTRSTASPRGTSEAQGPPDCVSASSTYILPHKAEVPRPQSPVHSAIMLTGDAVCGYRRAGERDRCRHGYDTLNVFKCTVSLKLVCVSVVCVQAPRVQAPRATDTLLPPGLWIFWLSCSGLVGVRRRQQG